MRLLGRVCWTAADPLSIINQRRQRRDMALSHGKVLVANIAAYRPSTPSSVSMNHLVRPANGAGAQASGLAFRFAVSARCEHR